MMIFSAVNGMLADHYRNEQTHASLVYSSAIVVLGWQSVCVLCIHYTLGKNILIVHICV